STVTSSITSFDSVLRAAAGVALELIEAPRALPILDDHDYKTIRAYVQHFYQVKNQVADDGGFLTKLLNGKGSSEQRKTVAVTEILGSDAWQRYEDDVLVDEGVNLLGRVPVVHIQNMSQPYFYEGLSDVEQLMSLQDELNTRLSDRASRITLQAFKMYLAKGIEGVGDKPISPGRMWCTDNPDATIESFGGDNESPSENQHIAEVREAMDKVSGVTPVVAGVLKNKLGNLSSAVALKMTFMGMLSKTYRKQLT
ncbi:MAG: phage portal protein, partial [Planctomycetes bacterium]|nr:phage portal protein [Planctomycetota bacterium]